MWDKYACMCVCTYIHIKERKTCITLLSYIVVFHFICDPTWVPTILPSWERNLQYGKKLTLVQIMNSVGLNSKIIVDSVGIFNVGVAININIRE